MRTFQHDHVVDLTAGFKDAGYHRNQKIFNLQLAFPDGSYRVEKVRFFKEHGRERYLSEDEAARLLAECHADLRTVVLIPVHTGFRSGELKSLTWPRVDLKKGFATVINAYAKNGETGTVPLPDELPWPA